MDPADISGLFSIDVENNEKIIPYVKMIEQDIYQAAIQGRTKSYTTIIEHEDEMGGILADLIEVLGGRDFEIKAMVKAIDDEQVTVIFVVDWENTLKNLENVR